MTKELADIDLLLLSKSRNGQQITVARDGDDLKPIWLPKSEIEIYDTGRKEAGLPIITVTMPQWLAEDRELV